MQLNSQTSPKHSASGRFTIKRKPNHQSFWIFFNLSFSYFALSPSLSAQILPDTTLPVNSVVTPEGNKTVITGGTTAGGNLFHSFREFSLPTGNTAYFNNALSIENIITRVTGSSVSNIDGLIRSNGSANLFLLNPNGIIFGPNAALNIGGSFLGTTAESFQFSDGNEYSATNPQAPPLLSISVPIGLQFGTNPGTIRVEGTGHQLSFDPETGAVITDNRPVGLAVPSGETLALVAGSISLVGSNLTAPQGRIELGSVASGGLVTLSEANPGWQLGYAGVENFQDIRLSGAASADVSGRGAGNIHLQARQLTLSEGSAILALTEGDISGGSITVNTTDSVELIGTSGNGLFSSGLRADTNLTGNASDFTIETKRFVVRDGAQIATGTFGQGNSGNLTIRATDTVEVTGTATNAFRFTGLFVNTGGFSTGDAGDLTIETGQLRVNSGGQISTASLGQGKAGNLTIRVTDTVEVIGASADGFVASGLRADAGFLMNADGGNLTIETGSLIVRDGGQIATGTIGQGSGGNLTIRATDLVAVIGTSVNGFLISGLRADAAGFLMSGDAGNLTIETGSLIIQDGAQVSSGTFGDGNGGNLTIRATDLVAVIGTTTNNLFPSGLRADAGLNSTGDAGDLTIETGSLIVQSGAQVATGSLGQGGGGNLTIRARDEIEVIGASANGFLISGLRADAAGFLMSGDAGNLTVETGRLIVRDGGVISTGTFGQGNGGTLTIRARDEIEVSSTFESGPFSSGLSASTALNSTGDGGDIQIETGHLTLVGDRATVSVSSDGTGAAGNLVIDADSVRLSNSASLRAETLAGDESRGNITLNGSDIQMRRGSDITTNARGSAAGGNITINTDTLAALENSDITANAENARGGQVFINAQGIFGTAFRESASDATSDITASSALGTSFGGTVSISTPDIDPSSGLVELATNLIDVNNQIANQCTHLANSSFAFIGRGGLPPTPFEPLESSNLSVNLATPVLERNRNSRNFSPNLSQSLSQTRLPNAIVEAQGWVMSADGTVMLVAQPPRVEPGGVWYQLASCAAGK